jgi:hypothetical protein
MLEIEKKIEVVFKELLVSIFTGKTIKDSYKFIFPQKRDGKKRGITKTVKQSSYNFFLNEYFI